MVFAFAEFAKISEVYLCTKIPRCIFPQEPCPVRSLPEGIIRLTPNTKSLYANQDVTTNTILRCRIAHRRSLLENRAATAANVEQFLYQQSSDQPCHEQDTGTKETSQKRKKHTIPVSADRCCDWKNTASISLHFGHCLFDLGS